MKSLLAAVGVVVVIGLAARTQAQQSEWRTDYAAALTEARQSGKPLFAVIR